MAAVSCKENPLIIPLPISAFGNYWFLNVNKINLPEELVFPTAAVDVEGAGIPEFDAETELYDEAVILLLETTEVVIEPANVVPFIMIPRQINSTKT